MEKYRRKPGRAFKAPSLTVARYSPPLSRLSFGELSELARMAQDGEVREVTFSGGLTVLVARYVPDWDGQEPGYTETEPGEYLAYNHGSKSLFTTNEADLAEWYEKEEA